MIEKIKLKFEKINFDIPDHKDIDYTPLFAASNTFRLVPEYSEKIVKIAKNNHSIIGNYIGDVCDPFVPLES